MVKPKSVIRPTFQYKGMEHMASFDFGYKIAAVRDWLFEQSKYTSKNAPVDNILFLKALIILL
jgi:hypothetical protein